MNIEPAQPITATSRHPDRQGDHMLDCPDKAMTAINTTQLANVAELLRPARQVPASRRRHRRPSGRLPARQPDATTPNPQTRPGYNANPLIDQVSFTAHTLRAHRQQPLARVSAGHR